MIEMNQKPYKSVGAALLFGLFLGPLGLLYANLILSLVLSILTVIVAFGTSWGTVVIFIVWFFFPYINVYLVERYNQKLWLS